MRGFRKLLTILAALLGLLLAAAVIGFALPGKGSSRDVRAGGSGASQGTRGSGEDPFGKARGYVGGRHGSVAAFAEDLRTGRTWTLGSGTPQAEASMVKMNILQGLLARHPGGLPAGQKALARKMMTVSDNDAATALWNDAGGPGGIGGYDAAAGLAHTKLSSCVRCPGFSWPGWGLSTTTPADQAALLRQMVAPGTRLTAAARRYALSLMEDVTPDQRWGVSSGVPSGVTVALKNGWLPMSGANGDWQVNTAGWVSGGGRDYLLVVMSAHNPTMAYGTATVSKVGSLAWAALGSG
ncbi:MAG: class A beta-lactamase-related serine hydrolase [Streptosporangiales bacterium]|nr:class A beta-lactamase-related serine hydrolase [Streptosporangiales bacterium]